MRDVKYYKEGARNYMVLSCSAGGEKSYQQKMLERQKLPHIFPCKMKYINGETFYYYDITSKVNMKNLHRAKAWDLSMIKKVLLDYEAAAEELDSFLLEQEQLVLDPEYIYYDYASDQYIFLFYPEHHGEGNIYEALFDFWVEHLDNQDAAAVECIYKLYEEAENCCLGIGRIKELLERYSAPVSAQEQQIADIAGNSWVSGATAEKEGRDLSRSVYEPDCGSLYENGQTPENQTGRGTAFYMVFLVLVALGELGVGAVYLLFQCTEKEKLVLLAAAVVMACLFICACRLLAKEKGLQKRKERYDMALREFRENDYEEALQPMPEKVQMKEFLSVGRSNHDRNGIYGMQNAAAALGGEQSGAENHAAGETVFFSPETELENKLYALDKKNKQHISLDTLPVTIGKLKGAVDICLNDTSVSRMHAQIETDGTSYYIKDLNSTNGTFLNGLRLSPNARMEIEPGDEIKFGKLRYSFR